MKWQRKVGRKGGGFRLKESLEIPWSRARSEPGNSVLGRRVDTIQLRAAMVSPTPGEAATQRARRNEGRLLSLSEEHNPGQTVSISETPPLSLAQKGLQYILSVLYFPHFYQRTPSKVPRGLTEHRSAKEEAFEAIFLRGISLHIKNMHWPLPHPLVTPSPPTFAPEGANSLCLC